MIIRVTDVTFEDQNTMVVWVCCIAPGYLRNFEIVLDPCTVVENGFWGSVYSAVKNLVYYDQTFTSYVGAESVLDDIHVSHMKAYAE